jgi:hypothetical protein
MPVVSVLAGLFDYLPFTQLSLCHRFLAFDPPSREMVDFQAVFSVTWM